MATTENPTLVLRTDKLDTDLLRLLLMEYTVIVEQRESEIIIELYPK